MTVINSMRTTPQFNQDLGGFNKKLPSRKKKKTDIGEGLACFDVQHANIYGEEDTTVQEIQVLENKLGRL
jgi:hypothetical protein